MNIWGGIFWIFLTVYHEARGEPAIGQKNVVKVILNRASNRGWPAENIVKARKQFSCYNKGLNDPSLIVRDIVAMGKVAANVYEAIKEWEDGDRLNGATHYYASSGPNKIQPPYWAKDMTPIGKYGHHLFLREG